MNVLTGWFWLLEFLVIGVFRAERAGGNYELGQMNDPGALPW